MKTLIRTYYAFLLFIITPIIGQAQIIQNFNMSVNQIGDCWQNYNMYIETQGTLNKNNQKKALTGLSPNGNPAYHFTSPIIEFSATGTIDFRHKMSDADGTERILTLYLLDQAERVVQVIYTHVYRTAGTSPNGNPVTIINTSIPVTWTGIYILRWEWNSVGGVSVGMVDDVVIDGVDMSDGTNDNGYGYCRPDDYVIDTVCAGVQDWDLKVPYPIPGSDWSWDWFPDTPPGLIDTSIVDGPMDSTIQVDWNFSPGVYVLEATEIRPPHMTTTYSVEFTIYVLDYPQIAILIDSVCNPDTNQLEINLVGIGPWEVTYTDGTNTYTQTFSSPNNIITLPPYSSTTNITVLNVVDVSGCSGDPSQYPTAPAVVYPRPGTGPIYH